MDSSGVSLGRFPGRARIQGGRAARQCWRGRATPNNPAARQSGSGAVRGQSPEASQSAVPLGGGQTVRQGIEDFLPGACPRRQANPFQYRHRRKEHVVRPQMGNHRLDDRLAAVCGPGGIRASFQTGTPISKAEALVSAKRSLKALSPAESPVLRWHVSTISARPPCHGSSLSISPAWLSVQFCTNRVVTPTLPIESASDQTQPTRQRHPGWAHWPDWNWKVVCDLETLARSRFPNGIVQEGQRDLFGFLGICALSHVIDAKDLWREAQTWARKLLPIGYVDGEYRRHASAALDRARRADAGERVTVRYTISKRRMIELLHITPDEMPELHALIDDDHSTRVIFPVPP